MRSRRSARWLRSRVPAVEGPDPCSIPPPWAADADVVKGNGSGLRLTDKPAPAFLYRFGAKPMSTSQRRRVRPTSCAFASTLSTSLAEHMRELFGSIVPKESDLERASYQSPSILRTFPKSSALAASLQLFTSLERFVDQDAHHQRGHRQDDMLQAEHDAAAVLLKICTQQRRQ